MMMVHILNAIFEVCFNKISMDVYIWNNIIINKVFL